MASTRIIEEERGTCTGRFPRHNGYWAGDFSASRTPRQSLPAPSNPR